MEPAVPDASGATTADTIAGVTSSGTVTLPVPVLESVALTVHVLGDDVLEFAVVRVAVATPDEFVVALWSVPSEIVHVALVPAVSPKVSRSPLTGPPEPLVTVAVITELSGPDGPISAGLALTAMVFATTAVPWPICSDAEPPSTVDTEMVQNTLAALAV